MCSYTTPYIVQPPHHSHAIILLVQIKTACFGLLYNCTTRKSTQKKYKKKMEFPQYKALKQAVKMKHKLNACILIPTLARYTVQLK